MQKKTKRNRRPVSIESKIIAAQEAVERRKAKYERALAALEERQARRDELRVRELMAALTKSEHTYEEVLNFIRG